MVTITIPDVQGGFTLDDLADLPHCVRWELRNGKLVIGSRARLWHQRTARRIANLLERQGKQAETEVGVRASATDSRIADIGVFHQEPDDVERAWHDADLISMVVEVWSASSDSKDRNAYWHADRGIQEYWFAEPVKGEKWAARVTIFKLGRTASGAVDYVEQRIATLDELEREA
ncbi:Uma2 family endonuclease [Asanoa iriomotensis]|uniref:Putative restriction endonuclease domain-containing protein n=1 Tax=Asanoa iriomotensis TaxID=234613 RepID=A0ABQ4BY72_9ACTN|nr:Uma2 family endonuclease [Asanoa iriomotensis]GIF55478.1 hypothetical protein Air01nite_15730 [Asanoa iriomotensis]